MRGRLVDLLIEQIRPRHLLSLGPNVLEPLFEAFLVSQARVVQILDAALVWTGDWVQWSTSNDLGIGWPLDLGELFLEGESIHLVSDGIKGDTANAHRSQIIACLIQHICVARRNLKLISIQFILVDFLHLGITKRKLRICVLSISLNVSGRRFTVAQQWR